MSSPNRLEMAEAEVENRPRVVTIDGPSVSSKSSVLKVVHAELAVVADVQCEVAGDFFRGITAEIYEQVGDDIGRVTCDPQALDALIECALSGEDVYRPRSASELDSSVVDAHVSRIGRRDITQYAVQDWYDAKVNQAKLSERSFLILDGRNPRERIKSHIEDGSVISALDLLLNCSVSVAAKRALIRASRHSDVPVDSSPEAVAQKEIEITERREMDATRKIFPYEPPMYYLDFCYPQQADGLVAKSWGNATKGLPTTIRLDTTDLTLEEQSDKVRELVGSAISHPSVR